MADETLTIQSGDARLTVIGKSWPDLNIDSGPGIELSDLGDIDPLDIGWEDFVDDPDNMPVCIKIVQQPYKLTYKENEKIKLSGIIVKAYMEDGSLWDGSDYGEGNDGQIVYDHLNYEPKVPVKNSAIMSSEYGSVKIIDNPADIESFAEYETSWGGTGDPYPHIYEQKTTTTQYFVPEGSKTAVFMIADRGYSKSNAETLIGIDIVIVSDVPKRDDNSYPFYSWNTESSNYRKGESGSITSRDDTIYPHESINTVLKNKTAYRYGGINNRSFSYYEVGPGNGYNAVMLANHRNFPVNVLTHEEYNENFTKMAWTAIYGTQSGWSGIVTVSWKRPDGVILYDTFDITIESNTPNGGAGGNGGR